MKNFIVIILSLTSLCAFSQKERPHNLPKLDYQVAHFGYSLGLNSMDFRIRPSAEFVESLDTVYAVELTRFVGFNINIVSNIKLGKYLDLRFLPGLIFGQRNFNYKYAKNNQFRRHGMMIESTFLDFPLLIKYRAARINNWRPYLIGGFSSTIDLAAQKKIKMEDRPKIRLGRFDVNYEIGVGFDFFLEYFMFGVELKSSFGMLNSIAYDTSEYTKYYDKLNSRMIVLSFHFEGGKIDKIKWWR